MHIFNRSELASRSTPEAYRRFTPRFSREKIDSNPFRPLSSDRVNGSTSVRGPLQSELGRKPGDIVSFTEQARIPVANPIWKRFLDLFLILFTVPVLIPVMFLIGAGIFLVSPGPIFFRQKRIGYRGRPFTCWKFRSMKVNADTNRHEKHLKELIQSNRPMVKLDGHNDYRLIPLGAWIRSTGLDELPQIFNVIGGSMSLVGPRPCLPYEFENYAPEHMDRFHTVPGLTGLWQVSGKNHTSFSEMIDLDIRYARKRSIGLDIKILVKTFPAVLQQIRELVQRRLGKPIETPLKRSNANPTEIPSESRSGFKRAAG